jgi:hypothetical protein
MNAILNVVDMLGFEAGWTIGLLAMVFGCMFAYQCLMCAAFDNECRWMEFRFGGLKTKYTTSEMRVVLRRESADFRAFEAAYED